MSKATACSSILLSKIVSNDNSRATVDVSELMSSIKQHGMLQPIGVMKDGTKFSVVYGNRRYAAAKKLKMASIPCVVLTAEQAENTGVLNLVENLQRSNPNVFSIARYMQRLIEEGYSKGEIASFIDKPLGFVRSCLEAIAHVPTEFRKSVVIAKSGGKASGIALSTVSMIESNHRQLAQTKKKEIYRLAKSEDYSAQDINRVCKIVAEGRSVKEAVKSIKTYETLVATLNIHVNDYKKIQKHLDKYGSYSNVISGILSGEIKETLRTM